MRMEMVELGKACREIGLSGFDTDCLVYGRDLEGL